MSKRSALHEFQIIGVGISCFLSLVVGLVVYFLVQLFTTSTWIAYVAAPAAILITLAHSFVRFVPSAHDINS